MNPQQFFAALANSGFIGCQGNVAITLNGLSVITNNRDPIGHLVQEWILGWARSNGINGLAPNTHTQLFPDYFLTDQNGQVHYLEIKTFNHHASPAFDVADFYAFLQDIITDPKKLYADFLIISYSLNNGVLTIHNSGLMKIWEIVGRSRTNHITCQIRNGNRIQKIRPKTNLQTPDFSGPLDFLQSVQNLLNQNSSTAGIYQNWLQDVQNSHFNLLGLYIV